MPNAQRDRLAGLRRMQRCERWSEGDCAGRITWEHVMGRVRAPDWSVIALCVFHHLGKGLNKQLNKHIAYGYACDDDLRKYKTYVAMKQEKEYLFTKYGSL